MLIIIRKCKKGLSLRFEKRGKKEGPIFFLDVPEAIDTIHEKMSEEFNMNTAERLMDNPLWKEPTEETEEEES